MMKPKRIEAVLRAVFSLTLFFAMVWPTLAQEKTAPLLVVISAGAAPSRRGHPRP